jgi:hypothetical protein
MFGFLKKLFGFDKETMKEAGVQIEQAPYKAEPPVLKDKVAAVNAQPVEKPVAPKVEAEPAKKRGGRKPAAKKEPAPKKEPAKKAGSGRSRKPKTGA